MKDFLKNETISLCHNQYEIFFQSPLFIIQLSSEEYK